MDEARRERLAKNEAVFRKVNEGIEAERRTQSPDETFAFVCECGALGCNALIELTGAEYEAVRASPVRFFIVEGHDEPSIERIVEHRDGYQVVEKVADQANIAEETDPRA